MLRRDWLQRPGLRDMLEIGLERLAVCEGGRVLESNEAFAYYLGYDPEELRGQPLSLVLKFEDAAADQAEAASDRSPSLREATAILRGGKMIGVEVASKTLEVGRRTVELIALRDLSVLLSVQGALQRYQSELERKNRDLERANRVKGEFLATLSHEVRTPLTSIIGYAQLLEDDALTRDQRSYLARIQESGLDLLALVEGLIDMSRLEARELPLYREEVVFSAVLGRVLTKLRPHAEAKGQTLSVTGQADVTLNADPARLEQILGHFISNAIKFTPLGGALEVRLSTSTSEFRCEVRDNGRGVAPDDLPHIFQPFFQVARLQGREQTGAGLGLALAERLSELHGGRVWVESELGQGSLFGFALPREVQQGETHTASYAEGYPDAP